MCGGVRSWRRVAGGFRGFMVVLLAAMADCEGEAAERRHLRVEVTLQIKFGCFEDMEHMIRASTMNLSRGGMFICTAQTRPKGQRVVVELPGDDGPVRIPGQIRHVRSIDGHPFGLGIEFDPIEGAALAEVDELLKKIAGGEVP